MRELKFRAWHKVNKVMNFIDKFGTVPALDQNIFEIMQFTGLKDKNGKEIFEGDIVKRRFKMSNPSTGNEWWHKDVDVVEWNDDICGFDTLSGELEVIGNIYENKDVKFGLRKGCDKK